MQYHALALAVNEGEVDLVGLEGAPLHAALTAESRIRSHRLSDRLFRSRTSRGRARFVLMSAARASMQAAALLSMLLRLPKPDVILVQNPPALPTLPAAWMAARIRGARLVIDWHNLSHTMLAVRLGEEHRAVRALKRSERRWARRADAHICSFEGHWPTGCRENGGSRRRCCTTGRPRSSPSRRSKRPTICGSA